MSKINEKKEKAALDKLKEKGEGKENNYKMNKTNKRKTEKT